MHVVGSESRTIDGPKKHVHNSTDYKFTYGASIELVAAVKSTKTVGITEELYVGAKIARCAAFTVTAAAGYSIEASAVKKLSEAPINEIKGKAQIRLTCGGSSIVLFPGKILMQSPEIILDAPSTTISNNTEIKGKLTVRKLTAVKDDLVVSGKSYLS